MIATLSGKYTHFFNRKNGKKVFSDFPVCSSRILCTFVTEKLKITIILDKKIKLKVQGITHSQVQSGAYALILSDDGPLRIPVIVGVSEAQSIAVALENATPPRPLTHDLFVRFAIDYHIQLKEVFIYKFEEGIFYAEMVFDDGISETRIDARTSDAVAIALRMKCNIYTLESIIRKCGILVEDIETQESDDDASFKDLNPEEFKDRKELQAWLSLLPDNQINERMEKAISEEKYEFAKMYKEELQRRENIK